jgi:hypothetical protein
MKYTYFKMLFIIASILSSSVVFAQSGTIYCFFFTIDPDLTNYIKIDDHSRKWLSGYSESTTMPDQLIDSIKMKTEEAFTNKLKMPVKSCYHKNKKGEDVGSIGVFGQLEGLASNTFNGSKKDCPGNSQYIYLDVKIYPSEGTSITLVKTKSKLQPRLEITTKVLDENKNKVWSKSIVIKDFEKIRSETKYYGSVEVTKSEVLTPFDIYAMYLMGLDKLMSE